MASGMVRRAYTAVQRETLLVVVLAGSFLARWLLADRNSYWLDELYSVAIYGVWNDSVGAALDRLADTSVHPPMYQAVLYGWMRVFGDSEWATRTLSNLYITLGTLFLYLLVRPTLSRQVALWSAVVFALMFAPVFHALETRSYAQTMFLTALSSYALLRIMRDAAVRGWRPALVSVTGAMFMLANTALLLTHYYNAFFYFAQGVIAGIFVLRTLPPRRWLAGLGTVAAVYGVQGLTFALLWADVLIATYRRQAGRFTLEEEGLRSPLELLSGAVTRNIDPPPVLWWIVAPVVGVVVVRAVRGLLGGRELTADRQRAWTVLYLVGWLALPLVMLVLAFLVTGTARYNPRYVLYAVPALAPLVVLTIAEGTRLADTGWRRLRGVGLDAAAWTNVGMAVVLLTLVIPGTVRGVGRTPPTADWRGLAKTIVSTVESNPRATFVLFDTSWRPVSELDYYLARYSDDLRATGVITMREEGNDKRFDVETRAPQIERYDYLIVAFVHHSVKAFPNALRRLSTRYPVEFRQVDERGRGLIIFSVGPFDGSTPGFTGPN
jgi:uncharacterized membrane protein